MLDRDVRKKKVLEIVIRSHIDTAEPVGSRFVGRRLGFSGATIRNIMADLEDEGLIRQPHTSAGRIPTDKAYRLYVDSIVIGKKFSREEKESIKNLYFSKLESIEDPAEYASHIISAVTHYTGFVLSPEHKFYLDGTYHILEQPEFRDIERTRSILQFLEERDRMAHLLGSYFTEGGEGRVSVRIGGENTFDGFKYCSVITASCRVKHKAIGGLGLIGPTRMQYEKAIPVMEFLSEAISSVLEETHG